MKYERLTENGILKDCCYTGGGFVNILLLKNRLAELEDKIEDGTLVELPEPYIEETSYDNNGGALYQVWHSRVETHCSYIEDTFLTKEAAEARLKELTENDCEK